LAGPDAIDHRPALIARCGSTEDVQAVVWVARAHGLPSVANDNRRPVQVIPNIRSWL
jgi:FAD/FMN-containing dehydrogenase